MASRFSIDVSKLPFPDVIERLSFEAIVGDLKTDFRARWPDYVDLESEPITMLIEAVAFAHTLLRARINDASKAVFVAYATGADLDNLAALYGVARLLILKGDPDAFPPTEDVWETDDKLRDRVLLGLEAQSAAGPRGAYLFHAQTADPRVADVSVVGPDDNVTPGPPPGEVWVYLMGRNNALPAEVLGIVAKALNAEDVRPLCDTVLVMAAASVPFTVTANLKFYDGPDRALALQAAKDAVAAYLADRVQIGQDISRSGIMAALHQPGVQDVQLVTPAANIVIGPGQYGWATTISVNDAGTNE